MLEDERKILKALHLSFISFGAIIIALSFAAELFQFDRERVSAAAGIVSVDDASVTIDETGGIGKFASNVRINTSSPFDKDAYSYDINYTVDKGCTISTDFGSTYAASGTILSIPQNASSYSTSNSFYVTGVDDTQIGEADLVCTATFTLVTGQAEFNGDQATFTITHKDDDAVPAIIVEKLSGSSVTEGETTKDTNNIKYSIETSDPPISSGITATVSASEDCQIGRDTSGGKGGGSFTMKTSQSMTIFNYYEQLFTVHPVDDDTYEGTHSCTVSFSFDTADPEYGSLSVASKTITVNDNDPAPANTGGGSDTPTSNNDTSNNESDGNDEESDESKEEDEAEPVATEKPDLIDEKDSNNDGVEDKDQPNVKVIDNPLTEAKTAIVVSNVGTDDVCQTLSNESIVNEAESGSDQDYDYPFGLYRFEIECSEEGAAATVSILLHNDFSDTDLVLRKFIGGEFVDVAGATFESVELQKGNVTRVTYSVEDGGSLDEDGEVNGVIVDPVGPAQFVGQTTLPTQPESGDEESPSSTIVIIAIVVTVVAVSGGVWFIRMRRKNPQSLAKTKDVDKTLDDADKKQSSEPSDDSDKL